MKNFNGKVLFLDRNDINTDEIIPAKYLTELTKEGLKPYLLEDLKLNGFHPAEDLKGVQVIVTRDNFGCGSSREHAPWALEVNGINLIIAQGYARIFRQNMFNNGMIAATLPESDLNRLFDTFAGSPTTLTTDFDRSTFTFTSPGKQQVIPFVLSDFDRELVKAGGWVDFADKNY